VSSTPAKKPPTADRPESSTATAPVGGSSEDHISPREIGLEEWSRWIIDNRHCDYNGIDEFLGDAINDIPGPLRDAMTGWLKTAITAAVNVGREETELMGERNRARMSPMGETAENCRIAVCARITVRTDPTDDGDGHQVPLQGSAEVDDGQRDSETEFGTVCSSAGNDDGTQLATCGECDPTGDRTANSTPSLIMNCSFASDDVRGFLPSITGPPSQADSEVGELSNRMRHDGDPTLGSTIQNIDDEIRLCRQLFAREREVTLHDCEDNSF
jgi:hypothetical protein